jgi:hypothetical protein
VVGPLPASQGTPLVRKLKVGGAVGCCLLAGVISFVATTRLLDFLTEPMGAIAPIAAHPQSRWNDNLPGSQNGSSFAYPTAHVPQVQVEGQSA